MNDKLKNSFLFNLVVILLLCIGFYYIFFASLGLITRHSSESKVPDLMGKHVKTAYQQLEKMGFEIEIDSTYDPTVKPFIVMNQSPEVNAIVKEGRTIFLTINKAQPPLAPMPKLQDLSYRSALMILKSSRLVLGDTIQKPDYANGAVLDQLYNGRHVNPGELIPQGSRIDLVVGIGFANAEINVPDVIGMSAEEGVAILSGNGLTPIVVYDGSITDSATAVIYNQTPAPYNELNSQNRIKIGDVVDVRVMQHPSVEDMENNRRPAKTVMEDEELNTEE
ncbi:MAG TPA: PASTA domain-containing protein [Flavipsychrobacter sp.]|nr:PASTA domain-containing protein [Flavipsychrobacter sp.]